MITTATIANAKQSLAGELALLTLSAAVPIEIDHLRCSGGPDTYQIEAAQAYIRQQVLDEAILFADHRTGHHMAILCEIVAILAWQPGGVTIAGLHFEASEEGTHAH